MLSKLITKVKKVLEYRKNPKYVVIKGIANGTRCIMSLGARPTKPYFDTTYIKLYGYADANTDLNMSFENQPDMTWLKTNRYKIIWTFKELIKWRRLLPATGFRCLEYRNHEWVDIKK